MVGAGIDGGKIVRLIDAFNEALDEHDASASEAMTALTNCMFMAARAIRDMKDQEDGGSRLWVLDMQRNLKAIGGVALTLAATEPELWDQVVTEGAAATRRAARADGVDVDGIQTAFMAAADAHEEDD